MRNRILSVIIGFVLISIFLLYFLDESLCDTFDKERFRRATEARLGTEVWKEAAKAWTEPKMEETKDNTYTYDLTPVIPFVGENECEFFSLNLNDYIPTWPDYIELEKDLVIICPEEHGIIPLMINLTKGTKIYFND